MGIMGLFVMIPASALLVAFFFVLFAVERAKEKDLKLLGQIVAVVLLVVSCMLYSKGLFIVITGQNPVMRAAQDVCPMMRGMDSKCMEMGRMGMGMGMRGKYVTHK